MMKLKISELLKAYDAHSVMTNGKAPENPPAYQYGYVFGAAGETCTEASLERRARSYAGAQWQSYYTRARKWIGRRVYDCNSLMEVFYKEQTGQSIDTKAKLNYASWCGKRSGAKADKALSGMPQMPGVAVFSGPSAAGITHVGVLLAKHGEGPLDWYVLEARGADYGVVKTTLKSRDFAWWGVMDKFFEYDLPAYGKSTQKGDSGANEESGKSELLEITAAKSVYLRSGPAPSFKPYGTLRRGTRVTSVGRTGDWYEVLDARGEDGIAYISARYAKVVS
ncbi:MAG: SH3 domain-containing protein [Christensenellaceae bacterium]|nr:SH3 domain-containing protein [Christensenellaceae bacterium]